MVTFCFMRPLVIVTRARDKCLDSIGIIIVTLLLLLFYFFSNFDIFVKPILFFPPSKHWEKLGVIGLGGNVYCLDGWLVQMEQ